MLTKSKLHPIPLLLIALSLYSCHSPAPIDQSISYRQQDSMWLQFRNYFIHNTQAIAASNETDSSHVVIIAEPPGWVTEDDIKLLLEDYNATYRIKQFEIGYDGWVKDIVISINDLNHENYSGFLKKLNHLVFKSDYKPFTIPLPLSGTINPYLAEDINLDITSGELKKWFLDDKELLIGKESKQPVTLAKILLSRKEGVYYSSQKGFVVWALPTDKDLSDSHEIIRQFTVDGDLILGAISENGMLCIIARERQEDVYSLPPLRTETVMLLASADHEQIAQSYERNAFYAGKLPGGKDWAPIYLSDELMNTEYGSLLNTTDQMLKSWSENGNISYTRFDYPLPDHWAFHKGIHEDLNADQITYNWNTTASVYSVEDEGTEYIALNKIGALPVTYIPEGQEKNLQVSLFESKAYNFFSQLNNRDLIRANQYAALYQIFKKYNINLSDDLSAPSTTYPVHSGQTIIEDKLKVTFNRLYLMSDDEKNSEADRLSKREIQDLRAAYLKAHPEADPEYLNSELEIFTEIRQQTIRAEIDSIISMLNSYKSYTQDFSPLCSFMSNRHASNLLSSEDTVAYIVSQSLLEKKRLIEALTTDTKEQIKTAYADALAANTSEWIKTPAIVVSWGINGIDSTVSMGGHNIRARVTPVRADKDLLPGQLKVVEEAGGKVLYVHPSSLTKVTGNMIKEAENGFRTGSSNLFSGGVPPPPRARNVVIAAGNSNERGLAYIHLVKKKDAMIINGKEVKNCNEAIDEVTHLMSKNTEKDIKMTFEQFNADEAHVMVTSTRTKKINYSGKLPADKGFFKITNEAYDFERLTITGSSDITISIPSRAKRTGVNNFERNATIKLKQVKPSLLQKIVDAIQKIKNKFRTRSTNPRLDFVNELRMELKQYGIKDNDIQVSLDDCYMCKNIHQLKSLDHDQPYNLAAYRSGRLYFRRMSSIDGTAVFG